MTSEQADHRGERFDAVERRLLCDLLDEVGPDGRTLLDPWSAHDLVAHLVLRERHLAAAPGLVVPGPWRRVAEWRRLLLTRRPFPVLVSLVRAGPPPGFFRLGWVRDFPNLNEMFVHHEDVRRANGLGERSIPAHEQAALFRNAMRAGRYLSRRLRPMGLELAWPERAEVVTVRRGTQLARLSGPPPELLLHLFGRAQAARVAITGPPEAVNAVHRTAFGM